MKHILLIGGRGHELEKVEKLGLRYSMVQVPEWATAKQKAGAAHYAVADYRRIEELLPLVRSWHAADPFQAVVSFTEYGLEPASRCAIDLGIPGDNLAAVLRTRDKPQMRRLLDLHQLSPVRHRLCDSLADAREFLAELRGPIVLKPPAGGLSEGVFLVEAEDHLAERWGWTKLVAGGPVLAEEYLSGPEYSVESFSRDGKHEILMITEKQTTGFPGFVELGHQLPAGLSHEQWDDAARLVTAFLDLIEQKTGPVHSEIRITPDGPRIIESQTRTGGDQIWEMCELVTGADMTAETFTSLLGLPSPPRVSRAAAAAIRFFAHENVRVLNVHGVPAAERAPGVVRVLCTLEPGQCLGGLASSDSRQGYVLCVGDTAADAAARAEAARDLVRADVAPADGIRAD